jgi:hypothetical protein
MTSSVLSKAKVLFFFNNLEIKMYEETSVVDSE